MTRTAVLAPGIAIPGSWLQSNCSVREALLRFYCTTAVRSISAPPPLAVMLHSPRSDIHQPALQAVVTNPQHRGIALARQSSREDTNKQPGLRALSETCPRVRFAMSQYPLQLCWKCLRIANAICALRQETRAGGEGLQQSLDLRRLPYFVQPEHLQRAPRLNSSPRTLVEGHLRRADPAASASIPRSLGDTDARWSSLISS